MLSWKKSFITIAATLSKRANKMNIILCIDDAPIRYQDIKCDWAVLVTLCRIEDYRFWIQRHMDNHCKIVGVMLDHDMPFQNGVWFAEQIRDDLQVPVALTSNNKSGRDAMHDLLNDYELPVIHTDCSWVNWSEQAMAFISSHFKPQ